MRTSRDCSLKGIILRKTNYRNSSLLMEIFSEQNGKLTVLGKGIRNEKNHMLPTMEIGNELLWQLHKNEAEMYYLKQSELIHSHFFSLTYEQSLSYYAALELYLQLEIPQEEADSFYRLLLDYFSYLKTVSRNGILIFWRFLLKIFRLYGIPLNWTSCVLCDCNLTDFSAHLPGQNGFICSNCRKQSDERFLSIQKESGEILQKLPIIGNLIESVIITPQVIRTINQIFLTHLHENFHKPFHFKSLSALI